jgi:hypothetical protein
MTYAQTADLASDTEFNRRLSACLTTEAVPKTDELSDQILRAPTYGAQLFSPIVSAAPGFADAYGAGGQEAIEDGMILSAVQASWDRVAGLLPDEPAP